jgi:hypothetical protein
MVSREISVFVPQAQPLIVNLLTIALIVDVRNHLGMLFGPELQAARTKITTYNSATGKKWRC